MASSKASVTSVTRSAMDAVMLRDTTETTRQGSQILSELTQYGVLSTVGLLARIARLGRDDACGASHDGAVAFASTSRHHQKPKGFSHQPLLVGPPERPLGLD